MRSNTILALIALGPTVSGGTFIVDDDGGAGVDFTSIAAAVAAADTGDVLLVRPGDYGGFFVSAKGLTILGEPGVSVGGSVIVDGTTPDQVFRIASLRIAEIWFDACEGSVLLDEVRVDQACCAAPLNITECTDVRLNRCVLPGFASQTLEVAEGAFVRSSRVELSACSLVGEDGEDPLTSSANSGGAGLRAEDARVHLAQSSARGGAGAGTPLCAANTAGSGAPGVIGFGSATWILVAGADTTVIAGGDGGGSPANQCDGFGASGVRMIGASAHLRWSGVTIVGGDHPSGGSAPRIALEAGATVEMPAERDPVLETLSTPTSGGFVDVRVSGEPGSAVVLHVGRRPVVVPDAPSEIERLTSEERSISLGVLPANGERLLHLAMPGGIRPGTTLWAQAATTSPSGSFQRSNSVPFLLR